MRRFARVRFLRRLARDRSGLALIEFGLSLPILLGIGCYATECANLALANLQVSQMALNLADNASRVGSIQDNNTSQLREVDINDVLVAIRLQGAPWALTTRGRITLSSLEERDGGQYIHWQRCLGARGGAGYDSHYGTAPVTSGTGTGANFQGTRVNGMGKQGALVTAPPESGVMFVEINYEYAPVVSAAWLPAGYARLHYTASYVVRDRRVFDRVYNPAPEAQRYTCDRHTAA